MFFLGEPFARGFLAGIQFSHCDICLVTVFTHGSVLHSDDADSDTLCNAFYRDALCVAQRYAKMRSKTASLQRLETLLHLLGRDVLSVQRPALGEILGAFEPTDDDRIETGVSD